MHNNQGYHSLDAYPENPTQKYQRLRYMNAAPGAAGPFDAGGRIFRVLIAIAFWKIEKHKVYHSLAKVW